MHLHLVRRSPISLAALSIIAAFHAPALAADPAWLGAADCRIAPLQSVQAASWSGACTDGYASGKGVLAWKTDKGQTRLDAVLVRGEPSGEAMLTTPDYTYTGTVRNGVPHGRGKFAYPGSGGYYEGEVADGLAHGKGTRVHTELSRYTGDWAAGKRHGRGEASFATGGSYTGEWKNDRFDGQGRIVYAGSGRSFEGRFQDGRVAGAPALETASGRHAITGAKTGTHVRQNQVVAYLPVDTSWAEMTPAQQNALRANYPALEAGDEPPFPKWGERVLFENIHRFNRALGPSEGQLAMHVLVGKDGKPKNVSTHGVIRQEMVNAVQLLAMVHEYKPARCQGQPCEMVYPVYFDFKLAE